MTAIQDLIPGNHCYGCGPDNPHGMRIKSHLEGGEAVCTYMPRPEQCAGPIQYLYGGTIASLIDCHSICTAIAHQYIGDGYEVGDGPPIWCVTGKISVNYVAPTPIDKLVELRARVVKSSGRKVIVNCTMYSDGTETANGEVVAIRVPDSWREE